MVHIVGDSALKNPVARFYRLASGREPVREWLMELPREDRRRVGRDIMKVEFGWPCGPPLCAPIANHPGLWEMRCNVSDSRIARVFFAVSGRTMLLLHGFIRKSQATPRNELVPARRRMKEHDRHV